jgi:hypothetical protein
MVCLYNLVCIWVYHGMLESDRLATRCSRVLAIEDRNGLNAFGDILSYDVDGDGLLDREELTEFLENEGVCSDAFFLAMAVSDANDKCSDGKVSIDHLMEYTTEVLVGLKSGKPLNELFPEIPQSARGDVADVDAAQELIIGGAGEAAPSMGSTDIDGVELSTMQDEANSKDQVGSPKSSGSRIAKRFVVV